MNFYDVHARSGGIAALAVTEKQSRAIVDSSLFIRNPDSQTQNIWQQAML